MQRHWDRFPMLNSLRQDSQTQHVGPRHGLSPRHSMGQNSGRLGHVRDPAAVRFKLDFD